VIHILGKWNGLQMFVVWEPWYIFFFPPELFTHSLKWPSVIRLASQNIGQVFTWGYCDI